MRVSGYRFPGLDTEYVIAKVDAVCPLGDWCGGVWGHGGLGLLR